MDGKKIGFRTAAACDAASGSERRGASALALLIAAQIIISLDFSLVSVALPSISKALGIGPSSSQWVLTADSLVYGGFLIVGGRIADNFGQKTAMTYGLILFTLGSCLSAFAPGLGMLIGARILQGLGAALTYPATLSLLALLHGAGSARFRALTIATAAQAVGVPLGTIVGGLLVTRLGWHAAFILNIPVCLAILAGIPRLLPSFPRPVAVRPIPFASAALLAGGVGLLIQAALGAIAGDATSRGIAVYTLPLGLVVMSIFLLVQRVSAAPLISPALLRTNNLGVAVLVTALMIVAGKGMIVLSNIAFQQGLHFTALEASLALLPMGVASLLLIPLTPPISGYLLPHPKAALGCAFIILGSFHFLLSMTPGAIATAMLLLVIFLQPFASVTATNVGIGEILKDVMASEQGIAAGILYTAVQILQGIGFSLMIAAADRSPGVLDDFARFSPSYHVASAVCVAGMLLTWAAFRSVPAAKCGSTVR